MMIFALKDDASSTQSDDESTIVDDDNDEEPSIGSSYLNTQINCHTLCK